MDRNLHDQILSSLKSQTDVPICHMQPWQQGSGCLGERHFKIPRKCRLKTSCGPLDRNGMNRKRSRMQCTRERLTRVHDMIFHLWKLDRYSAAQLWRSLKATPQHKCACFADCCQHACKTLHRGTALHMLTVALISMGLG